MDPRKDPRTDIPAFGYLRTQLSHFQSIEIVVKKHIPLHKKPALTDVCPFYPLHGIYTLNDSRVILFTEIGMTRCLLAIAILVRRITQYLNLLL